jgi:1,4-alpha-glucan branching enzyme
LKNESDKVIAFEKDHLLFVFNFHPTRSFTDYRIGTNFNAEHKIVLSTDNKLFGGLERVDESVSHVAQDFKHNGRDYSIQVIIFDVDLHSMQMCSCISSNSINIFSML